MLIGLVLYVFESSSKQNQFFQIFAEKEGKKSRQRFEIVRFFFVVTVRVVFHGGPGGIFAMK
jgi:hypothetical protein